ncbi:MAG: methylmalonyl-CoA mutase, partial [Candidatus Bathyarchaeota archaeon]
MYDEHKLSEIHKKNKNWKEKTVPEWISRHPERKNSFHTSSNIHIKRLYTPEDIKNVDYTRDLGFPGEPPFTRGLHATMYRGRLWTMRQFSGYGTAQQTNKRFKYLLKEGETGLSIAFDYP